MKYSPIILLAILSISILAGCTVTAPEVNEVSSQPTENEQQSGNHEDIDSMEEADESEEIEEQEKSPIAVSPVEQNSNTPTEGTVSSGELAMHNTKEDCWIGYQGNVYDVTSFLPKHPGGVNAIARYCGTSTEFEEAFTKKHKTSQVSRLKNEGTFKGALI